MTGYLVPSLCGQTYLYGSHADASVSSRIVTALTMHIDPTFLTQALAEAMTRFPQISVGLVESDERRTFIPVSADVPVFRVGEPMPQDFSDSRLNGYLFRVSYCHKHLYVDYHRALADEVGMMAFVKALVLRYLELSGFPVRTDGSVKLLSSEYFKAEGEDPMLRMEDAYSSKPVWFMDAKAVSPQTDDTDSEEVVQVRIPLNKLKKDYLDLPVIPVTYVAPFLSHAIHEAVCGTMEPGEYVVASVQINLRPYYPSASLRPYHTPVFLAYNRNLSDYPYSTVLMSQKKLLEAQLKNDTLAYSAQRKIADIDKALESSVTLAERDAAFEHLQNALRRRSTYDICRIGNVILPESMQRLVTEFYPVIPSSGRTVSVSVSTFKGELAVTVSGRKLPYHVCLRLVDLLQENDIEAYVADHFYFSPLVMK
ncbi:MAG: hypothetical protein E7115_03685 [Bacteroidales bacterium]|nr:hypothetical protein [Bacteroidales bacterium]